MILRLVQSGPGSHSQMKFLLESSALKIMIAVTGDIFTVGKTVYSCQKSGGGVVVVVDQFMKTMKKS